jgi:hypothetical protein
MTFATEGDLLEADAHRAIGGDRLLGALRLGWLESDQAGADRDPH